LRVQVDAQASHRQYLVHGHEESLLSSAGWFA
jgi:hypothetical protein